MSNTNFEIVDGTVNAQRDADAINGLVQQIFPTGIQVASVNLDSRPDLRITPEEIRAYHQPMLPLRVHENFAELPYEEKKDKKTGKVISVKHFIPFPEVERTIYVRPYYVGYRMNARRFHVSFPGQGAQGKAITHTWYALETDDKGNLLRDNNGFPIKVMQPVSVGEDTIMRPAVIQISTDVNGAFPIEWPRQRYILEEYLMKDAYNGSLLYIDGKPVRRTLNEIIYFIDDEMVRQRQYMENQNKRSKAIKLSESIKDGQVLGAALVTNAYSSARFHNRMTEEEKISELRHKLYDAASLRPHQFLEQMESPNLDNEVFFALATLNRIIEYTVNGYYYHPVGADERTTFLGMDRNGVLTFLQTPDNSRLYAQIAEDCGFNKWLGDRKLPTAHIPLRPSNTGNIQSELPPNEKIREMQKENEDMRNQLKMLMQRLDSIENTNKSVHSSSVPVSTSVDDVFVPKTVKEKQAKR